MPGAKSGVEFFVEWQTSMACIFGIRGRVASRSSPAQRSLTRTKSRKVGAISFKASSFCTWGYFKFIAPQSKDICQGLRKAWPESVSRTVICYFFCVKRLLIVDNTQDCTRLSCCDSKYREGLLSKVTKTCCKCGFYKQEPQKVCWRRMTLPVSRDRQEHTRLTEPPRGLYTNLGEKGVWK